LDQPHRPSSSRLRATGNKHSSALVLQSTNMHRKRVTTERRGKYKGVAIKEKMKTRKE
jgi:hypothetical protein